MGGPCASTPRMKAWDGRCTSSPSATFSTIRRASKEGVLYCVPNRFVTVHEGWARANAYFYDDVVNFAALRPPSVLVIAVLAVLAGAAGPTAIARWAEFKDDLLGGLLDLPHGIPGKDVFRRVLMVLKPEAFEAAFNAWIAQLRDEATAETGVDRPIIAIDGKTARRSHDAKNDLGALHVVTAWAGENGLALGQVACAEKSNEITAIPELLKKIDVRGGVVTIDAMGTQKAIAEEIVRGEADYVLALKRNHETLHPAVIDAHRRAAGGGPGGRPRS